VDTDQPGFEI